MRTSGLRYGLLAGVCLVWTGMAVSPVWAHGACTVVSVIQRTSGGGFTPTILDVWAFPGIPMAPAPVQVVTKVLVCPQVVIVTPAPVFPVVVDPPAQPREPNVPGTAPALPAYNGPPATAPHDTVRDLARNPRAYDRQIVSLTGTVIAYQERVSDRDRPYAIFTLHAGTEEVQVVAWGHPGLRSGLPVRVTGTFYEAPPFTGLGTGPVRPVLEAALITPAAEP